MGYELEIGYGLDSQTDARPPVAALIRTARRRIRWAWASSVATATLPVASAAAAAVATALWIARRPLAWWPVALVPVMVLTVVACGAWRQRIPPLVVARAIERRTGHDGVIVSALEFADTDDDWHRDPTAGGCGGC